MRHDKKANMNEFPHHEQLRLRNFTAFSDVTFDFVPGINVFVGENGTGKTHTMKALFAWQLIQQRGDPGLSVFRQTFQVEHVGEVVRSSDGQSIVDGRFGGVVWQMHAQTPDPIIFRGQVVGMPRPVFIPAIDMLGHTKGFVSTYDEYAIDFDLTHRDIVSLLLAPEKRDLDEGADGTANRLKLVLSGDLVLEGERFYLNVKDRLLAIPTIAEGLRKVATLLRLVQGGWLRPGTSLFWDEPETNLNPVLMDEVVGALLAIARSGVQIFLATHSYILLEELSEAAEKGEVRYFGFEPSEDGVKVKATEELALLDPNPILRQYESLYNRKMERAFAARPSE